MKISLIIFVLAFSIRSLYILFQGDQLESKLIEDELLYWTWSLKGAYTGGGELEQRLLSERMPGAFIYYQFLMFITSEKLNFVLYIQAFLDSITCLIISRCISKIYSKEFQKVFIFASISPLMIIMASQTLADTLFLFLFCIFLLFSICAVFNERNYLFMLLSGIFLGLTTFVKTLTFPLIFLLIIPIFLIFYFKNRRFKKIIFSLILFLFGALLPISDRLKYNIMEYETFSLTSQLGTHLAYWITPAILCYKNDINREEAIKIVNRAVNNNSKLAKNEFEYSKILVNTSIELLENTKFTDIAYIWVRASFLNLIAPSILLDKKVRNLAHPSFYDTSEPLEWLKKLFLERKYRYYLISLTISSLTSLFVLLSLFLGPIQLFKKDKFICIISIIYILYFSVITGPVLSPKYIIPMLPCIFLYQAITISKVTSALGFSLSKKNNNQIL